VSIHQIDTGRPIICQSGEPFLKLVSVPKTVSSSLVAGAVYFFVLIIRLSYNLIKSDPEITIVNSEIWIFRKDCCLVPITGQILKDCIACFQTIRNLHLMNCRRDTS
jgi:hypothetical protein